MPTKRALSKPCPDTLPLQFEPITVRIPVAVRMTGDRALQALRADQGRRGRNGEDRHRDLGQGGKPPSAGRTRGRLGGRSRAEVCPIAH
jgi:hypothetical protein